MTSFAHTTPTSTGRKVTSSSVIRRMLAAAIFAVLCMDGVAFAQNKPAKPPKPAPADQQQLEDVKQDLSDKLAAEAAARKAAEEQLAATQAKLAADDAKLAADDAKIAEQGASLAHVADGLAAMRKDLDEERSARKRAEDRPAVGAVRGGIGITGFAQIDLTMRQSSQDQLVDATGDPLNEDRFSLRRARLRVTADYGHVLGAVELDANTTKGTQVRPVGADVSWKEQVVTATLGLFKIPFGYEVVQSDRDRMFMERTTTARALFPGEYDLGARAAGAWRFVRYAIAVQNGDPLGEKAFPGRDPNGAKDVTGRVGVDQDVIAGLHVSAGVSALEGRGFHKGTPSTKDVLVWRDLNEDGAIEPGEVQIIPGQAATPSQNFSRFAVGADVRVTYQVKRVGLLDVYGELVWASNLDRAIAVADPIASQYDVRELGWYVAATQELGEIFQVGVRYDSYDPDADATARLQGTYVPADASYHTLAVAAAARWQHGRLVLEYDRNRNHLGRDATGAPANLNDDAVILRGEVQF